MPENVQLSFEGLMVFCFNDKPKHCKVGILTQASGHEISLSIKKRCHDGMEETEIYKFPPKLLAHSRKFWVYIDSGKGYEPSKAAAAKYTKDTDDRWRFDALFNFKRLHSSSPAVDWDQLAPTIYFATGKYYSYDTRKVCRAIDAQAMRHLMAASMTANPNQVHSALDNYKRLLDQSHCEVGTVACSVGAGIEVKNRQRLVLAIGNEKGPLAELYAVAPQKGEILDIAITNLPTANGGSASAMPHPHMHDTHPSSHELEPVASKYHFLHYYKAFKFGSDATKYVVLEDAGATRLPRPDPPCLCMEC